MKKQTLRDICDAVIGTIFFIVVLFFAALLQGCTNEEMSGYRHEIEFLQGEIYKKNQLIGEYEKFREVSKEIYLEEVDSTGDTYSEGDKGCEFWNTYLKIDTLRGEY